MGESSARPASGRPSRGSVAVSTIALILVAVTLCRCATAGPPAAGPPAGSHAAGAVAAGARPAGRAATCTEGRPGATADRAVRTSPAEGRFSLVTYNVAGLPDFISHSHPAANMSRIAERLDAFDIVLVQEDFFYHRSLVSGLGHRYRSRRQWRGLFCSGDGLNRFSAYRFSGFRRERWRASYGVFTHDSDALGPKGFSAACHEPAPGVKVDIYNLHMDAGGGKRDAEARRKQLDQLASAIARRSDRRALIVAGDWNLRRRRAQDAAALGAFMRKTGLADVRVVLGIQGDRIDRILFRSGDTVELRPLEYRVERELFRDQAGEQLSDHLAVSAVFSWRLRRE